MGLAALFHDIGKVIQRSDNKKRNIKHQKLSHKFIKEYLSLIKNKDFDLELVADLVKYHHESDDPELNLFNLPFSAKRILALIIDLGDNYSSYERIEREDTAEILKEPLYSICSKVKFKVENQDNLPDRYKQYHHESYHLLEPLNISDDERPNYIPNFLPKLNREKAFGKYAYNLMPLYDKLYKEFLTEFENLIEKIETLNFESLINILLKYFWSVPSAIYKSVPDISLFSHLKSTCAISIILFELLKEYLRERDLWDSFIENDGKEIKEDEFKKIEEYLRIKSDPKFLVLGLDFSGIQRYIFSIAQPEKLQGVKGVSRRLRGRSLFLSILGFAFSKYIISKTNVTIYNIIYDSGGNSYILLPNTKNVINALKEFEKEVFYYLKRITSGDLKLFCSYVDFSAKKFKEFSQVIDNLNLKIREQKKKIHEFLQESPDLLEDLFSIDKNDSTAHFNVCISCNRVQCKNTDKEICEICELQEELGTIAIDLKNICYLFFKDGIDNLKFKDDENKKSFLIKELNLLIILSKNNVNENEFQEILSSKNFTSGYIEIINSLDLTKSMDPFEEFDTFSVVYRFLGKKMPKWTKNHIEIENGKEILFLKDTIVSLDYITKYGCQGAKYLAALKMDVDNLGAIFSLGLGEDRSISRMFQLSLMMDLFFGYYINHLTSINTISKSYTKQHIREIIEHDLSDVFYLLFSGGDDLFILGPWDKIIYLARTINKKFSEFTGNNPYFTLSGGIFIVSNPKFPIYFLSEQVEKKLHQAKHFNENNKKDDKNKKQEWIKNKICIFDDVLKWDEGELSFKNLLDFSEYLYKLVEEEEKEKIEKVVDKNKKHKKITKSKIYALLQLYQNYVAGDKINFKYFPALVYILREYFDPTKGDPDKGNELIQEIEKYKLKLNIPIYITSLKWRKT